MNKSGIYKILNKVNGKYYVGSSKDIDNRWKSHRYQLNHRIHKNKRLQNDWCEYGNDNFDFISIESISLTESEGILKEYESGKNKRVDLYLKKNMILPAILLIVEQRYLDIAKKSLELTYQQCFTSDGGELTEETRKKISDKLKGRVLTKSHREKISQANRSRIISEETRKKIGKFSKSRIHTEETKNKIGVKSSLINHDKNVYKFINNKTNEEFVGTRNQFRLKYLYSHSGIWAIIRNKFKTWKYEIVGKVDY